MDLQAEICLFSLVTVALKGGRRILATCHREIVLFVVSLFFFE